MRVVLDPNIVLATVSRRSPHRPVIEAWQQGRYGLCVSTEILLEYEEKLNDNFGTTVAELTVASFVEAPTATLVSVHYAHRLISADPPTTTSL